MIKEFPTTKNYNSDEIDRITETTLKQELAIKHFAKACSEMKEAGFWIFCDGSINIMAFGDDHEKVRNMDTGGFDSRFCIISLNNTVPSEGGDW